MAADEFVYGIHAVESLLARAPEQVLEIWLLDGRLHGALAQVAQIAARQGLVGQRAQRATLDRMAEGGRHQGVIARCRSGRKPLAVDLKALLEADLAGVLFLVLDGVEDPHNVGACLRVADAAGVRAVIRPEHRGTGLTAAASKVASGAAETVPVVAVANLARALQQMKQAGVWLVGTAADAPQTIHDVDLTVPTAVVMGGEGGGLRRLTREACDHLVRIPMRGTVGSLNVSVAAGICLFEVLRQRRPPTVGSRGA